MSVAVELWRFAEMLRKRRLFEPGTPVVIRA